MAEQLPPLRVVAAVIVRDGRVLGCRRNVNRLEGGLWEFPGGKIEPGEHPVEALVREIDEELGVSIAVGSRIHRATTEVRNQRIDLDCYEARLNGVAPLNSTDHDLLRWFKPEELSSLEWCLPDRPVVDLIASGTDLAG